MAKIEIGDRGSVNVFDDTGSLLCSIQGGAYVSEDDVAVVDEEVRIRSGGNTQVFDLQGRPLRME